MANTSRIISISVSVALGAAVYFWIRDVLVKGGQANLVSLFTIGMICAIPIAFAIVHWEDKLMSFKVVNTTVAFFKKTQWVWLIAIAIGIVTLGII